MSANFIFPLIVFATLSCATPGPNTLMLTTSGVNFGFRLSMPYSVGIIVGRTLLQISIIFFLGAFFNAVPKAQIILKVLGSIYLLYLSFKITSVKPINPLEKSKSSLTFLEAVLYQFLNPKVWVNTITAGSLFILDYEHFYFYAAMIIGVFALVSLVFNSVWVFFGVQISKFIYSSLRLNLFNLTTGVLNATCIILIWMS